MHPWSKYVNAEEENTPVEDQKSIPQLKRDLVHLHSASKFLLLFGFRVTYGLHSLTHVRWFHHE